MKNLLKVLLVVAVIGLIMAPIAIYATNDMNSVISTMDGQSATQTDAIAKAGGTIYKTIQNIGIIVAVIVTVAFGIQWIVATPAKKAELKGKMWNLVIGIAILLLASWLVGQVGNFVNSTVKGGAQQVVNEARPD